MTRIDKGHLARSAVQDSEEERDEAAAVGALMDEVVELGGERRQVAHHGDLGMKRRPHRSHQEGGADPGAGDIGDDDGEAAVIHGYEIIVVPADMGAGARAAADVVGRKTGSRRGRKFF